MLLCNISIQLHLELQHIKFCSATYQFNSTWSCNISNSALQHIKINSTWSCVIMPRNATRHCCTLTNLVLHHGSTILLVLASHRSLTCLLLAFVPKLLGLSNEFVECVEPHLLFCFICCHVSLHGRLHLWKGQLLCDGVLVS